ncbi:hypothetical protein ABMA32_15435 [Mesorhizobium sp. VNQ89]|uniref:hypothetical protein n=1 Tax=Mesorhizobium quangtriensis TaxID=3157709 RepID=UPI0032B7E6F1
MNGILTFLIRSVVVLLGYAVAALCSSAFLHVVSLPMLGFTAEETPAVVIGSVVFSIPFIALFVAYFSFIPSLFAILAGEIIGLRDWLYYAIAGGVIGAVVMGYFRSATEADQSLIGEPGFMFALIGAGMCGGLGYWLIAGRSAGGWRKPREITSPEPK